MKLGHSISCDVKGVWGGGGGELSKGGGSMG